MAESGEPQEADLPSGGTQNHSVPNGNPDNDGCQNKLLDTEMMYESGEVGNNSVMESGSKCIKNDTDDDEFYDANEMGACSIVKLKKDDSGIEITEKSPSASVQSENDLSGTDLSESHDFANQSDTDSRSEPANKNTGSEHSNQSESADERPRRRRRLSSSSSEMDEVSTMRPESSDSEEEMDIEPVVGEPKQRQIYQDVLVRERGYRSHISPVTFTQTISANLALVQRLQLQYKLEHHTGCVNALHYSHNGHLLASGSDDLKVVIWDWLRRKPTIVFDSGHRNNVFQAKFLPFSGDCHVVTCARDGQVRLAELSTTGVCKSTKKLAQHKGAAHKLALEMDSPHIFLSCGEDGATYQVDLREDKPDKLLVTKENDQRIPIYSVHSNPSNSHEFCLAGRDRYVRLYDKRKIAENADDPTLKRFCPQHMAGVEDTKCNVTCAVFNYNGTEVLGSYNDEDIYLFDTSHSDGADYIKKFHGHRNNATVKGVNFYGLKSEYIVSGSDCGNVYIWEKQSEKVVQFFAGDEGGVVNVLEPHPCGPYLATSGLDNDIKIWAPTAEQAEEMKELRETMKKNRKERRHERSNEPEMLDGQAIWLLMQHLRRTVRRREANGEEEESDDESLSESDSDEPGVDHQCNPS